MGRAPLRNLVWLIVLTVSWVFPGAEAPPVEVTVGANPVQTGTGWNATLSVASASQLFQVDWNDPEGNSILTRINGEDFVKPGTPYTNRVSLLANGSLVIASVQLSDEGNYSVKMEPQSVEGLTPNTVSIELLVYVPVRGVRVRFSRTGTPEGTAEISIACTFTAGSRLSFSWLKDGNPLSSTGRVNVSGNAVRIQQISRADAGSYTCRAQNAVSSGLDNRSFVVYYGPETVRVSRDFQSDCVSPDQVILGRSGTLECQAVSVPPANFSWSRVGQLLTRGNRLFFRALSANQTGSIVCTARNTKTEQETMATIRLVGVASCLNVGAVVGIVIGAVVALLLLILLIVYFVRRRRNNARPHPKKQAVNRSAEVDAKVQPWISRHQETSPGFSTHPVYATDAVNTYRSNASFTGSMVPSTIYRADSSLYNPPHSGHLSTLF